MHDVVHYVHFDFFFNDTATTEIYTLSLHDALPISKTTGSMPAIAWMSGWASPLSPSAGRPSGTNGVRLAPRTNQAPATMTKDRKSTRLNSSHANISYAVFCLKKKRLNYSNAKISYF